MTEEERMKILKMLEQETITAEEADRLFNALDRSEGRALKILVYKHSRTYPAVNINIPLNWIQWAYNFIPKAKLKEKGIDLKLIKQAVTQNAYGKILEVDKENEKIEIYIV